MEIVEYPDSDLMMIHLAEHLADELSDFTTRHGAASFAVPGGSTPGPLFDALSAMDLAWENIHVMLTDERWVPEDHPRSNTALLRQRLLVNRAAPATLVPLFRDGQSAEDAIPTLSAALTPHLPLSVCLLGMGTDMHTASLFPGGAELNDALHTHAPLSTMTAPGAPEPRITLTAATLNAAWRRHIVIIGAQKREALERARHLPPHEAPVAAILPGSTVHWAPD